MSDEGRRPQAADDPDSQHRQTSFAADPKARQHSYDIEDRRWTFSFQLRDWGLLALLILFNLAWMGLVFLLEPGLR
jgi:hypothetical protein